LTGRIVASTQQTAVRELLAITRGGRATAEPGGWLLTTECVVVEKKEEKSAPGGGPPGGGMGGMY
jgi:hypothetical protein